MLASDADDEQHQADEQELAQESEVALRHRGIGREGEEHRRRETAGKGDQLTAVAEPGGDRQDRRQHQAGDEREAEEREHAPCAVAQPRDHEERPDHHAEHQQRRHDGRRLEQADEIELHARQRTGDGRQHRQREQPVRVAKHTLAVDATVPRASARGSDGAAPEIITGSNLRSMVSPDTGLGVRSGPLRFVRLTESAPMFNGGCRRSGPRRRC